jgi:hypothetical protein|tara:strand:- start:885 stop:1382 length:498 start_codon:yes stop_codon:yes gene_type:complete
MLFDNINEIKEFGFKGFEAVDTLMMYKCSQIPKQKGIYFVLNNNFTPSFLQKSVGGHFKKRNPTVPVSELKENWVDESLVVYIGKAGGANSKATLQSRLKQYMRFGEGEPVGHWGGRLIWQLANHRDLIICYKPLLNTEPREEEKNLILKFEAIYGIMPFANLSH